jgi:hypothetical protein
MNLNILSGLIFVAVFAGVVIIHEFGHYIVALLCKVEVEEFGIGLPPRALKMWRRKGYFIFNGQRIEIPSNFDRALDWVTIAKLRSIMWTKNSSLARLNTLKNRKLSNQK